MKGQTWSTDVLIATTMFVLIFIAFFYTISIRSTSAVISELKTESRVLPLRLMSSQANQNKSTVFIVNNKVDKTRLRTISSKNYTKLKSELGIKNEFMIYFEDEFGNLINISSDTATSKPCIGSPNATLNGVPCGTT